MQGLYRKLSPFTPDSAGAAAVFADCPAMVVPFDMNGTVSTFRGRVGVEDESPVRVASALGSREVQYVLGDTSGFQRETARLLEIWGGEFAVLLHGPVSALVGVDLDAVAKEISEDLGRDVLAVDVSGTAPYDEGVSKALLAIFDRMDQEPAETHSQTMNLLGINSVDHNDLELRELLFDQAYRATGCPVISIWGSRDCWAQWEQARHAEENILMSSAALKLAQAMKRAWGIPFKRIDELDLDLGADFEPVPAARPLRALVVSEQLMGNVARKVLERLGCQVTVSSFHKMIPAAKSAGDFKMKSEADLVRSLASGDYDIFVGDPHLQLCMPADDAPAFIPLKHSAVALNARESWDVVVPFTGEWLHLARDVVRECAESTSEGE